MERSTSDCLSQAPLVFLDSSGNQIAQPNLILGSGSNDIATAAADSAGNIWIAGNTNSDDFPLVHPFVSTKAPYAYSGFVAKLDPTGSTIRFSSFLDGSATGSSVAGWHSMAAVTYMSRDSRAIWNSPRPFPFWEARARLTPAIRS